MLSLRLYRARCLSVAARCAAPPRLYAATPLMRRAVYEFDTLMLTDRHKMRVLILKEARKSVLLMPPVDFHAEARQCQVPQRYSAAPCASAIILRYFLRRLRHDALRRLSEAGYVCHAMLMRDAEAARFTALPMLRCCVMLRIRYGSTARYDDCRAIAAL